MVSSMVAKVSVITPTWHRTEMVLECIRSVEEQDYPNIQHVVISDGPDYEFMQTVAPLATREHAPGYELICKAYPEHDDTIRWGHRARRHGIEVSNGELIAYLDDDNTWRPDHLSKLEFLLSDPDIDFAYSSMQMWNKATGLPLGKLLGRAPPSCGNLDTSEIMHRREILDVITWRPDSPSGCPDWDIVERWIASGAKWAHNATITGDYWLDPDKVY